MEIDNVLIDLVLDISPELEEFVEKIEKPNQSRLHILRYAEESQEAAGKGIQVGVKQHWCVWGNMDIDMDFD